MTNPFTVSIAQEMAALECSAMGKPKLLTIGGFLSFFAFGFVDNLKGPLLPELLEQNGYTYSQGAMVLSAGYLGFILATLATGILSDIFSNRLSLLLAGLSLILGCSLIGFGNSFFAYFVGMGFLGIGLGAIELGGNGLMVELHPKSKGRYLNLLGMCHGLGSLTVPLIAAGLLSKGVGWQSIYFGSSVTALPLLVIFGSVIWHENESVVSESNLATKNTFNWASVRETSFTREMWLYYILLAAYVACELGVATWMVEFLQKNRGWEISSSSALLSSFFVLLMLGRLLGAFVVDSVGYSRAICIALLGSVTCLFVGINGGGPLIFALPLSGLFMSIVFPTVAAAASDLCQANSGTVFGILFAFAGVGGALGPFTIGIASDFVGIQFGLCTAIGFAAIALFALYGVSRKAGNQETT